MPALWESSQKPMYVRTVWVDGFRHAILTHDDPHLLKLAAKKKRPHSSASYGSKINQDTRQYTASKFRKTRLSETEEHLGECLRELNFILKTDKTDIKHRLRPRSDTQHRIEKLNLTELETESEDELILKANAQRLNEFESSRSRFNNILVGMRTVRSNRTARTENSKDNNELYEKVLQWLDLAGKIDMLVPENDTIRMSQPRHSWPEIQKKTQLHQHTQLTKCKTSAELKTIKGKRIEHLENSPKDKVEPVSGIIDRHEFYVTTPANTIENYARQSRNIRDTSRNNATRKLKDPLNKTKSIDPKCNIEQTRQTIANEIQAVEKQYADLINKKIIPNFNKQVSKKQVHIFVPTLQKKSNNTLIHNKESLKSHVHK